MRITNVLKRPIVTEKSLRKSGEYAFAVSMTASKGAVADEVHKLYGVDVVDVRTTIVRGKKRRIAKTPRYRTTENWKKAYVVLKDGQTIDLFTEGTK